MSTRQKQIASTLQRAAEQVLARGLADPRVRGLITVTGVEVAPDRKRATILVSVLPEDAEDLTMHGLRHAARHVRHHISELVAVHPMPELEFRLDKSVKKQAAVLEALAKVRAEREAKGEAPIDDAPSDETLTNEARLDDEGSVRG